MKNKVVIFGCGGHARSAADIYLLNNIGAELIFVDEMAKDGEQIFGFPTLKDYKLTDEDVFVAIGDNYRREKFCNKQKQLCSIISKNAYIGKHVEIGKGVLIAHHSHIGTGSKIGDNVIVNTSASIDHDCFIGANSHIAPNATLCGKVVIGKNVVRCAGTIIINNISICDNFCVITNFNTIAYDNAGSD